MGHPAESSTIEPDEAVLQEEVGLIEAELGREAEQQQLLKLLSYCQTGQGKSVLVLGAEGIGKSALLHAFTREAERLTQTPSIILPVTAPTSLAELAGRLVNSVYHLAQEQAYQRLSQIQVLLSQLGFSWTETQVLELLKPFFEDPDLQTRPDAFEEGLALYLNNSLSFFKKLNPNSDRLIEQVIQQLNQPWLLIYAGFELGLLSPVADCRRLIQQWAEWSASPGHPHSESPSEESPEILAEETVEDDSDAFAPTSNVIGLSHVSTTTLQRPESSEEVVSNEVNQIARATANVFLAVSQILAIYKQAFILGLDQWDSIADLGLQTQSELKSFLNGVLRYTTDSAQFHGLIMLACRSEQESYLISNDLYNRFRQKLLLGPIEPSMQNRILAETIAPYGMQLEETVEEELYHLTRGNPALLQLLIPLLETYVSAIQHNPKAVIDYRTYREHFAVNRATEWVDLLLNQLHLSFVGASVSIDPLLTKLVAHYARRPFSAEQLVALSDQPLSRSDFKTLIERLVRFGFIVPYPEPADANSPKQYWFTSAFTLSILQQRLCPVQIDMPLADKVHSLKRIIPLSIESGEMDYEKVLNILSMAATLDDTDLAAYLEGTMINAFHSTPSEPIKRSLLNGLAAFASDNAIETIRTALHSSSLTLQEYACRQLLECLQTMSAPPAQMPQIIEDVCELAKHAPTPNHAAVQQAAYALLIHYPQFGSLTRVRFEEGLNSPDTLVQLLSIHGLSQLGVQTLDFIHKTQILINDPHCDLTLAQAAMSALEGFDYHHMMPILTDFLETQTENPLWNDGLKLMLSIEPAQALPWVEQTLAHPETDPEIKLYLLRHLGSERSSEYENAIIRYIARARHNPIEPELRWMAIRSLGWIGYSRESYDILLAQQALCASDPILSQTLQFAIQQLAKRLSIDEEDAVTVEAQPKSSHATSPASAQRTQDYRAEQAALDDIFTASQTQAHASAASW